MRFSTSGFFKGSKLRLTNQNIIKILLKIILNLINNFQIFKVHFYQSLHTSVTLLFLFLIIMKIARCKQNNSEQC
jgi:hypothetical protein